MSKVSLEAIKKGSVLTKGSLTMSYDPTTRLYSLKGINDKGQPFQRDYENGKVALRVINIFNGR